MSTERCIDLIATQETPSPIKEPPTPERKSPPIHPPERRPSEPPIEEPPSPEDPDRPHEPPIGDPPRRMRRVRIHHSAECRDKTGEDYNTVRSISSMS